MTYFGFLFTFLVPPILLVTLLNWRDRRAGRRLVPELRGLSPVLLTGLLVAVAVVWTTPWDNYLVATRVWWYDHALVTGVTIGWVPIEEYCFFALQPIMVGLWVVWLGRRIAPAATDPGNARLRPVAASLAGVLLAAAAVSLLSGYRPATYLSLKLVWALPPILIQLAFGADILWQHRRLVVLAIASATAYLAASDTIAISSGTWTIDPDQSFARLKIGGILPLEELLFFLLTNVLVVFGLVLGIARASLPRLPARLRPGGTLGVAGD